MREKNDNNFDIVATKLFFLEAAPNDDARPVSSQVSLRDSKIFNRFPPTVAKRTILYVYHPMRKYQLLIYVALNVLKGMMRGWAILFHNNARAVFSFSIKKYNINGTSEMCMLFL